MTTPILPGWGQNLGQALAQVGQEFQKFAQQRATSRALEHLSKAEKKVIDISREKGTAKARFVMSDGTTLTIDGTPDEAMQYFDKLQAAGAQPMSDELKRAQEKGDIKEQSRLLSAPAPDIAAVQAIPTQMPTLADFKLDMPNRVRAFLMQQGVDISGREQAMYAQGLQAWAAGEQSRINAAKLLTEQELAPLQRKRLEQQIATGETAVADALKTIDLIGKPQKDWNEDDRQWAEGHGLIQRHIFKPDSSGGFSISQRNAVWKIFDDLIMAGYNIRRPSAAEVDDMLANGSTNPLMAEAQRAMTGMAEKRAFIGDLPRVQGQINASIETAARLINQKAASGTVMAALNNNLSGLVRLGQFVDLPGLHFKARDHWRGKDDIVLVDQQGNEYQWDQIVQRANARGNLIKTWSSGSFEYPGYGQPPEQPTQGSGNPALDNAIEAYSRVKSSRDQIRVATTIYNRIPQIYQQMVNEGIISRQVDAARRAGQID